MKLLKILGIGGEKEKSESKTTPSGADLLYPRHFFNNNDGLKGTLNRLGIGEFTNITYVD